MTVDERASKIVQLQKTLANFSRCPLSFRLNTGIARIQASVAGKKRKRNRGLAVLLGVGRDPRRRPNCGWLADLFCAKRGGGGGRGDFVILIRVSSQKAVQSRGIFPVG